MEDTLEAAMERLNRSVERMIQLRAEHITLKTVEDAIDAAFDNFDVRSELEGIHSMTESSSSLSCDDNNSVNFVDKQEVNIGKEISAYKVFDEMSDRILIGIETQFSDILLCRTILRRNSVGFVAKNEVNSEMEISACKVFDVSLERGSDFSAKYGCGSVDDVIVELNDSKNLVFKQFEDEFGSFRQFEDEFGSFRQFFGDIRYCVGDFWGQKSLKRGVLGNTSKVKDIESFGWKPGWSSVDDPVDMKTNGVVKEVKDIKEYVCLENGSFSAFNWKSCWILVINKEFVVINTKKRWLLGFVSTIVGSFEWKPGWMIFGRNNNELQMGFVSSSVGMKWLKKCLMDKSVVLIKNESVVKLILGAALKIKMGYKYRNAQDFSEVVHSELRNGLKESELVVMKTDVILMDLDDGQQGLESVMGDLVEFIENYSVPTPVIHINGYDPEVVMADKSFLLSGTKVQISSCVRVRLEIFTFVAKMALVAKCHLAAVHRHKDVSQWQLIGRPGNCYDILGGALMNRGAGSFVNNDTISLRWIVPDPQSQNEKRMHMFGTKTELSTSQLGLPYKKGIQPQKRVKDWFWIFIELHKGKCAVANLTGSRKSFMTLNFEDKILHWEGSIVT